MDPRPPIDAAGEPSPDGKSRTLVLGDDRSVHADRAWLWINNQRWPGWRVDVVSASPPSRPWTAESALELVPYEPESPREATEESGIAAIRHLQSDADARLVLEACTEADLLVLGPRGSSGLQAAYMGSVVDHAIRHACVPVAVTTTPNRASRILVCTDGSEGAEHAVQELAGLPLAAGADQIAVVGVAHVGIYDPRPEIDAAVDRAVEMLADFEPEAVRIHTDGDVVSAVYAQIVSGRFTCWCSAPGA